MRIYIASPYTLGDQLDNIRKSILVADTLAEEGHAPFAPLAMSGLWHMICPASWEQWMRIDLAWVAVAQAIVRIPGESKGADQEVALAKSLEIPVFIWPERPDPCLP